MNRKATKKELAIIAILYGKTPQAYGDTVKIEGQSFTKTSRGWETCD